MLCDLTFKNIVKTGSLRVIDARGREHRYGVPGSQPSVAIRLHSPRLHWQLLTNPRLYMGEAWMDGTLTMVEGSLRDLLALFSMNLAIESPPSLFVSVYDNIRFLLRRFDQVNPLSRARSNVAHHYDLGNDFYSLFLDRDMQYSCAYFASENDTLEEAQLGKKRHIAAKLALRPGMRVLDIGCGWGGLALYLAREAGVHVTGLTLSQEQLKKARARAEEAGLEKQVEFHLRDYRHEAGSYDRIVSVGMFEHVGQPHYTEFFARLKALLAPDGVALLHSIGRMEKPGTTNPWLKKYIFPGGYSPAISEVLPCVEQNNMWLADMEILRLHYACTIEHWSRRFEANRARIAEMYDERFCRMWDFYLAAVEMEFRHGTAMVFQMQLLRNARALPITRDYMTDTERALSHVQKLAPARRYAVH